MSDQSPIASARSPLILSLILALTGCAASAPKPAHDRVSELPPNSFKIQWPADLGLKDDQITQLFVRENLIFVYTAKNMAYAFDRASGKEVYAARPVAPPTKMYAPVLLHDYVVYPTAGTFYVFDKSGKELPHLDLMFTMSSKGAVGNPRDSHIYYGSAGNQYASLGRVVCMNVEKSLRTKSQNEDWAYLVQAGGVYARPAFFQGALFSASDDGAVVATTGDSKDPIWPISPDNRFKTYGPIKADLKADESGVYAASGDKTLFCIDRASGRLKWQFQSGTDLGTHSPELSATTVYQIVPGTGMVALDKLSVSPKDYNRKPKWTRADALQFLTEDDKNAYLRVRDNSIVAVDKLTGQERFRSQRKDFVAFGTNTSKGGPKDPPAGVIYAATRAGEVYAITPVLKSGVTGERVMNDFQEQRLIDSVAFAK